MEAGWKYYIQSLSWSIGSDIYSQKPGDNSAVKIFSVSYSIGCDINSPISVLNSERYLFSTYVDTSIFIYENSMIREIKLNYNSLSNRNVQVYSPKWAPNETEIACMITEMDSAFIYRKINIVKMNPDGSNLKVLAAYDVNTNELWMGVSDFSLCRSPDGSKILFNVPESDLHSHIYVINADGSQVTQVTTLAGVYDISVSWSN